MVSVNFPGGTIQLTPKFNWVPLFHFLSQKPVGVKGSITLLLGVPKRKEGSVSKKLAPLSVGLFTQRFNPGSHPGVSIKPFILFSQ